MYTVAGVSTFPRDQHADRSFRDVQAAVMSSKKGAKRAVCDDDDAGT